MWFDKDKRFESKKDILRSKESKALQGIAWVKVKTQFKKRTCTYDCYRDYLGQTFGFKPSKGYIVKLINTPWSDLEDIDRVKFLGFFCFWDSLNR